MTADYLSIGLLAFSFLVSCMIGPPLSLYIEDELRWRGKVMPKIVHFIILSAAFAVVFSLLIAKMKGNI